MKNTKKGFIAVVTLIISVLALAGIIAYYNAGNTSNEIGIKTTEVSITTLSDSYDLREDVSEDIPVIAYIKSIEGNEITLDYVDLLKGEDAQKAVVADGRCTQVQVDNNNDCFPNGEVYYRNKNPKLRTFTISPDVQIFTASNFEESGDGITSKSIETFDPIENAPYELSFNSRGEVSNIHEIFRP